MRKVLALSAVAVLALLTMLFAMRGTIRNAGESYAYGYPLVLMDVTREAFEATRGARNQLFNVAVFPDASFREVVRPNVDTLYTIAWIDLAEGPRVFEVPATDRYYVMQFLDGWTDVFASIGPRTTGQGAGAFVIAGPDWHGSAPEGTALFRSPTRMAWLIGRIQTNGAADYPFVRNLQAQVRLRSLDDYIAGRVPAPSPWQRAAATPVPPLFQMRAMGAENFFSRLARLLVDNPPAPADQAALAKLAALGVRPGDPPTTWSWLDSRAAALGMWIADRRMRHAAEHPQALHDGWTIPPMNVGAYGIEYGVRAVVAMAGLGANLPADAVYPNAQFDADGRPLDGSKRYVLHFAPRATPPVKAFWSITAYDEDGYLIENELDRYALGDRDPLKFNADGSLDLYIQAQAPAEALRANWLPISAHGPARITARLYWPEQPILDGAWTMPGLRRVDD